MSKRVGVPGQCGRWPHEVLDSWLDSLSSISTRLARWSPGRQPRSFWQWLLLSNS